MKTISGQSEDIKSHYKTRLVPEGELKCVWMSAGLVAYKLCDQEYNCEFCQFNEAFLQERNFATIGQAIKSGEESVETIRSTSTVYDISKGLDEPAMEELLAERFLKNLFDFKIEKDFFYHDSHTWIELNGGYAKIGIDYFVCKFITKIKQIILPPKTTLLFQNHPCCWIVEESGTIPIMSPLSGHILSLNQELFENPGLPIIDPYGKGWLFKLKPKELKKELKFLYSGENAILKFKNHALILKQRFINELLKQFRKQGKSLLEEEGSTGELKEIIGYKRFFEIFLTTFTKLH